jgi:TolB protein
MMSWRPLCALALLLAGCTRVESVPDEPPSTTLARATSVEDLPGRLVVIGGDGNLVAIDPDGSAPTTLTDDAGEEAVYGQPFWSPDSSRLAWVELTASGIGIGLSDPGGNQRSRVAMGAPPFYMYWSPDGEAMGVLHNSPQGSIDFELVEVDAGTSAVAATGAPFYFSWSPDSDKVVAHIQGETLATVDRDGATTDLGDTASSYPAPHWTSAGILHLWSGGIELRGVEGDGEVVATTRGQVALVANPQGTRIAVQSYADEPSGVSAGVSQTPAIPSGSVVVLDLAAGEVSEVLPDLSVGFFWSPDGEALLVLDPSGAPGEADVLVWRDGETTRQFTMSLQPAFIRDVLQFFDQYSQSLRLWSPDSAAFALAGTVDGEAGIWVHLVGEEAPTRVFDGVWAAWSD